MSTSDQLQQAYRFIRDGNKTQATAILVPIVRSEPNNADAWWLLANAVSTPDQQRRALEQVLRLRPNDDKARRMLDRIDSGGSPASPPPVMQQPAQFPGTPSAAPPQPDPFAAPAPQSDPFGNDPFAGDPFADDPFPQAGRGQPAPYQVAPGPVRTYGAPPPVAPQRKGTNPLVIILAVVGLLAIIGCAACFAITGGFAFLGGQIIQQVAGTLTSDPDFQNLMGTLSNVTPGASNLGSRLSGNFANRGAIQRGQTLTGTVDTIVDDGWTFSGNGGESITIEVHSRDADLDPQLYFYDPERALIAENDDINLLQGDTDARIEITLSTSGTYTIIVSAFSQGGDYELSVR
jgi:hypothetical protein